MKLATALAVLALTIPVAVVAQTRSARDTATTYGARLDAKGLPANLSENRVNNRVDNRISNRLSLRIERYRPNSADNPTAAFQMTQDDKSRSAPVIALPQSFQDNDAANNK